MNVLKFIISLRSSPYATALDPFSFPSCHLIPSSSTLLQAVLLFNQLKLHRMYIQDCSVGEEGRGRLVGVLSTQDILSLLFSPAAASAGAMDGHGDLANSTKDTVCCSSTTIDDDREESVKYCVRHISSLDYSKVNLAKSPFAFDFDF